MNKSGIFICQSIDDGVSRIIVFALMICMSCTSISKTTFQDKGFSFEITEDFRVGRSDFYKKNKATYIPIYSKDEDVYAKLSVVWLPGACDMDWELWNYTDMLTALYKKSDSQNLPQYSEYKSITFGGNKARQVDYIVPNDGPRIGSYIIFHCDDISVIIGVHSEMEGKEKIDRCLALIEKTYRCTYQK